MLTIYEQDKMACMVQMQDFILPSPISYNIGVDSFCVQNSSHELELYRYSNIGAAFYS